MLRMLFFISLLSSLFLSNHSYIQCLEHQKTLLLQLKDELIFDSSISTKLVQWNERDECCKWYGVECDAAGYVLSLQLNDESISGGIGDSSSLFRLEYLQKLNLAYNMFNSSVPIPKGIHNLSYLTHLNLSYAGFGGQVPAEMLSLRRLISLDISSRFYPTTESLKLEYPNLEMVVQNLTGLRELYLDGVNITSSRERRKWSQIIPSYLPNLTALSFCNCSLSGPFATSFSQFHSLSILRLVHNNLNTTVPDFFANFQSLTILSLSSCHLKGSIPSTFANLTQLIYVDLSDNSFTGSLPSTLFEGHTNLVRLYLRGNSFSGNIPHSLYGLRSLLSLRIGYNQFHGTFQLDKFQSLTNVKYLDLSHSSLSVDVGNVNSSSYRLPQLEVLNLASCNLSDFPDFIKHSDVTRLDLSNNRITGEVPSWIWGNQLVYLDLSFNLLTGLQKPYHIPASLKALYLQSNQLRGELHLPIPPASLLWSLFLANNSLSGSIPTSLCSARTLQFLDLSGNKLSGSIPDNFSQDCWLVYFDLSNNALQGKIPKSLKSCRWLEVMNVGKNNINDNFPCMLPSSLRVLVLHSNRFHGEVTCHNSWSELQVVDISSNNFGGCLESINFSSWTAIGKQDLDDIGYYPLKNSGITLISKGLAIKLRKIWQDFNTIDLSCNNFGGEIPNAIGDLSSLHLLNLSHNALNGSIPKSFGQLRNLESLDLSRNQLTGTIPVELGGLTFLEVLNLSYNKLVGEIPNGRQLQTFSVDSFKGNSKLCGFYINISCSPSDDDSDLSPRDDENVEGRD